MPGQDASRSKVVGLRVMKNATFWIDAVRNFFACARRLEIAKASFNEIRAPRNLEQLALVDILRTEMSLTHVLCIQVFVVGRCSRLGERAQLIRGDATVPRMCGDVAQEVGQLGRT